MSQVLRACIGIVGLLGFGCSKRIEVDWSDMCCTGKGVLLTKIARPDESTKYYLTLGTNSRQLSSSIMMCRMHWSTLEEAKLALAAKPADCHLTLGDAQSVIDDAGCLQSFSPDEVRELPGQTE